MIAGFAATASAGIRPTDPDGNLTIPSGTNAADTINANGGTDPTPTVALETGATITGDPVIGTGIVVNADGYTIVNNGFLSGDYEAIFTTNNDLIVFNTAFATIQGGTDGIVAGDGLFVVNETLGSISGLGATGYGIIAGDEASVFNDPTATISGGAGGIFVDDNAEITNDGNIFGGTGAGVDFVDNGYVINTGLITGNVGINVDPTATIGSEIINSGEIRTTQANGDAIILGLGDDILTLNEGSLITGSISGGGGIDSLTFNGGLSMPGGIQNSIRGNVDGFSTITKQGGGVALIGTPSDVGAGYEVYADTINIDGGGLYINADVFSQTGGTATINANGAALGGTGEWFADVNVLSGGISAGAIPINLDSNPNNSVGAVAIYGDVVHSPGSFIRFDVVPDAPIIDGINSDIIEQIGAGVSYDVTGANLRISPTDINKVITPGQYILVDSDTPIIGANSLGTIGIQFNDNVPDTGIFTPTGSGPNYLGSVLTDRFTTISLADGDTNLVLGVDYNFQGLPNLTQNQASLGAALDTLALQAGTGTLGAPEQDLISALALSDLGTVQSALYALGPDSTFALTTGIMNSNYRTHRMVQNHLAMVRGNSGVTTVAPSEPMYDSKGGMIGSAPTTQTMSSRGNVWGAVSYDWQDYEDDNTGAEFDGETGAVTAGFDYRLSPMLVLGGLIDASTSDFDYSGGSSDVDSLRFIVYGTYGESLGFYSDFLAGYGTHSLDQKSSLFGTSFGSDTDADSLQAMLTFGYTMGSETVKHGPFAGLEYQEVNVDGFNRSAGLFSTNVGDYDTDSLRGLIGYRIDATYGAFRPYASVAYAHEFQDGGSSTTSTIGGVPFSVRGPEQGSSVLVTAGTSFMFNPNLALDVGYRGDISVDDSGITSHGATIGLNYSF